MYKHKGTIQTCVRIGACMHMYTHTHTHTHTHTQAGRCDRVAKRKMESQREHELGWEERWARIW